MNYDTLIDTVMHNHRDVLDLLLQDEAIKQAINKSILVMSEALANGNQILFCGNGGSAAEALTVNTSSMTAISNDSDYKKIFS